MEKLFTAIMTQWNATAGATVRAIATGGLWAVQAKEGATCPYVVFFPVGGAVIETMTNDIEDQLVQFSIFVTSEDGFVTCLQIRDALVALYDDQKLTMTGQNMVRMIRQTSGDVMKDPDEGYVSHVDYRVLYG